MQLGPVLRLGVATWRCWWFHGHAEEFASYGEKILARSEDLPPHQLALALVLCGRMRFAAGDRARARALLEQSLSLFRQAGDTLRLANVLALLGHLSALQYEYADAGELLEQSLALLREMGDDEFTGEDRVQQALDVTEAYNFLGQVRLFQGDHDGAARLFTEGLSAARRVPDRFSILISLYDLALSSQAQGDLSGAAEHLKEGLSVAAEARDETSVAYYMEGLAAVARLRDNPEFAVRLLAAARSLLEARGSGWLHAYVPRASHDEVVLAALRSRMADAAFEQAWAQGRSTGGSRAVEYALELGTTWPHRAGRPGEGRRHRRPQPGQRAETGRLPGPAGGSGTASGSPHDSSAGPG